MGLSFLQKAKLPTDVFLHLRLVLHRAVMSFTCTATVMELLQLLQFNRMECLSTVSRPGSS